MSALTSLSRTRGSARMVAVGLYLAGALVTQIHAVEHIRSGCACYGTDPTLFMWSMAWWPHAVLHLPHNPFVSRLIWVPGGLNLAGVTSVPTLALLGTPVTAILGPIATYNVWSILAPVAGAFCAYRLCLALTDQEAASIAGGWLYGFSTYAVTHLMGHLNLVFTFAAPALVLLCLRRLDESISPRRFVILTVCVLLAQLGISTEMLLTVTCAGAILLVATLAVGPPDGRRALLGLLPWLALAYLVTAILASPFLIDASEAPRAAGPGVENLGADLVSFIVPPVATWLGGSAYAHITQRFLTDPAETNAYLGLPLIAIFLAEAGRLRHDRRVRVLVSAVLVLALWSLGAHLIVDGVPHGSLPYSLISGTSVFNQVLPVRIADYVALGMAVAAALFIARGGVWLPLRWGLFLAAAVFLFPNPSAPEYSTRYVVPGFFTSDTYRRYIPQGSVVLPLPFAANGASVLWQADTHFWFRLASGNFIQPAPAGYLTQPATGALLSPATAVPADDDAVVRAFLTRQDVGTVVIQDGTSPGWANVLRSLGAHGVGAGGVEVFRLAPPL